MTPLPSLIGQPPVTRTVYKLSTIRLGSARSSTRFGGVAPTRATNGGASRPSREQRLRQSNWSSQNRSSTQHSVATRQLAAALGCFTMTLHKLSAGSGYEYLTRQVAAGDDAGIGRRALNFYTHIGMYYNNFHGTMIKW